MLNKKSITVKISEEQKNKLDKAKKDFYKLQSELAPFIKKRKFHIHSSTEEWTDTYCSESIITTT
jgi:hypothetical protein